MGRVLRLLGWLVAACLAGLVLALAIAHRNVRSFGGPLPTPEAIAAAEPASDLPTALRVVDTAGQDVPRSLVLDAGRDPTPGAPYRMSHPAFLFEWSDGRALLVDAGMEPEAAIAFGAPTERLGGGPTTPFGSAAEQLGARVATAPLAVVFTHLHTDHVQGLAALCRARSGAPIDVFQSPAQADAPNYTTRPGARQIETAGCARRQRLPDTPLAPVPGRPGVFVVHVAGHTPGSQVVIAFLGASPSEGRAARRIALAGDVANVLDGILHDVPKPLLYRLLVVPEADARLGEARRLLGTLARDGGFELAVSHDRLALERDGFLTPPER